MSEYIVCTLSAEESKQINETVVTILEACHLLPSPQQAAIALIMASANLAVECNIDIEAMLASYPDDFRSVLSVLKFQRNSGEPLQ